MITLICDTCKNEFLRSTSQYNQKQIKFKLKPYCSTKCMHIGHRTIKDVTCNQCGKITQKNASQLKKYTNHFCSKSCSATYYNHKNNKTKKMKICKECNSEFYNRNNKIYCSKQCQKQNNSKLGIEKLKNGDLISATPQTIKKYLIQMHGDKCSTCGIETWQNKPLVKVMDHIDGNSYNNDLSNLRLVCSNCDSQLDTYKSKNNGKGRKNRQRI